MNTSAVAARVALALVLAAQAGCARKAPAAGRIAPPEVGVVVLRTEKVPLQTELPGRTAPFLISEVRPQVNGIVEKRLFQEGASVRAGQLLYQIDPAPYRAAADQARAQLANAQANLTTARLRAERYADLIKINAVSQQDDDDAEAASRQAQAAVQQSQAALQAAQINLGYTGVRAPISGRTGRSSVTQGALVAAGQANALTTIQQLDPIYVDMTQSSAERLALERAIAQGREQGGGPSGTQVRLTLEDGSTYPLAGRLEFAEATVDPSSGAVTLRAIFPNPDGMLLPGMFVRATLVREAVSDGILVPQQGLSRDPRGGATVLLVDSSGKAVQRAVVAERTVGDKWLVTSGVRPGDRVIVEGLNRVQAGQAVRAVPAGSPPGPPASGEPEPRRGRASR